MLPKRRRLPYKVAGILVGWTATQEGERNREQPYLTETLRGITLCRRYIVSHPPVPPTPVNLLAFGQPFVYNRPLRTRHLLSKSSIVPCRCYYDTDGWVTRREIESDRENMRWYARRECWDTTTLTVPGISELFPSNLNYEKIWFQCHMDSWPDNFLIKCIYCTSYDESSKFMISPF